MSARAELHASDDTVRLSEVLAALSFALDLTDGQPVGHAMRSCLIGLGLADRLGLPEDARRDLYYALLLKDVGGPSQSAQLFRAFGGDERALRRDAPLMDWTGYLRAARLALAHVSPVDSWLDRARRAAGFAHEGGRAALDLVGARGEQGAGIVLGLGFGPGVAAAVRGAAERWDGRGRPDGLRGEEIPVAARIVAVAQALDVLATANGARRAIDVVRGRAGRWFDPQLAAAAGDLREKLGGLRGLDEHALAAAVRAAAPAGESLLWGPDALDRVAHGFAGVVDAKSPFTAEHSRRMAALSVRIAGRLGLRGAALDEVRRAALLHDIGKLSVPNAILDKPGPLEPDEWEIVKRHPYWTLRILLHVRGLKRVAQIAASHHERLDGTGYFRGLSGRAFPIEAQVLAAADQWDALVTARPYRPALPAETALRLMERERGTGVSPECLDALAAVVEGEPDTVADAA
uniref:HD domain-containing protein n=1 Tax=Eiseniibacteriota bacterium TaxID=2212470 RepID=A0A832I1P3_UNCEI